MTKKSEKINIFDIIERLLEFEKKFEEFEKEMIHQQKKFREIWDDFDEIVGNIQDDWEPLEPDSDKELNEYLKFIGHPVDWSEPMLSTEEREKNKSPF